MMKDEFLNKVECGVDGDTNSTNLHSTKNKYIKKCIDDFLLSLTFISKFR